ncbi:MAG: hypothetical protein NTZ94_04320 [Verrucomicrobia bacterium]|jgi:hypothetical protein|nr:hypothetical protein [Verrucomicrobiota bacterium]
MKKIQHGRNRSFLTVIIIVCIFSIAGLGWCANLPLLPNAREGDRKVT